MKNVLPISVCIPTYNRSNLIREAVSSCLNQTAQPMEIIISDDSPNDKTKRVIHEMSNSTSITIRYYQNSPSLKQASNVNNLFDKVKGEYCLLLHDDDTLLPSSLEKLYACFLKNNEIDVAFGKQFIMSEEGIVDLKSSEQLNADYYRTAKYEGCVLSPLESGFLQQFPNDGYLMRSVVARKIKYHTEALDACDFDFALRVGKENHKVYFLNEYTANYRLSNDAVSTGTNNSAGFISYLMIENLEVPSESLKYKALCLNNKAPVALVSAINLKKKRKAMDIYFSKWHRKKILSLGGIKRFALILFK